MQEGERIEIRDGKEYVVKVLPEALPPKNRSKRTRYKLAKGDVPGLDVMRKRGKRGEQTTGKRPPKTGPAPGKGHLGFLKDRPP